MEQRITVDSILDKKFSTVARASISRRLMNTSTRFATSLTAATRK